MASVSLRGVTKRYPGGVTALADLDLQIEDREFLVLLGPSGCGKSTTLRLVAGLEEITTGEVQIDGRVVNGVAPKDRNIAMVFQNYALYPHMSVYKNMAFGLQLRYGGGLLARGWKRVTQPSVAAEWAVRRREIPARVRQTAAALGIENLLDRMPRQLSGGERQRVALGRAMVRHPAVFLFDEPLSNLDAKLRLETRRELKRLHRHLEATMVYVTHDQTEALTLGQRIAVLDGGRLQQLGTPEAVYRQPTNQFVAGFIGSPPMNLLRGRIAGAEGQLAFVSDRLRIRLPDEWQRQAQERSSDAVVLGVRPEHLRPAVDQTSATDGTCEVVVTLVEPLGDTVFIHGGVVEMEGSPENSEEELVFRMTEGGTPKLHERVQLVVDPRQIHLFEAKTGTTLRKASSVPDQ
jgi:multiple sugar transport system ATP-binding protein